VSHSTDDPAVAVARLRESRRALITAHSSPDGDALGSELALAELASRLGVRPVVYNRDPAPEGLRQLPGGDEIVVADALPEGFREDFDLVVTMECPGLDRPGFDGLDALPILNIDHHKANPCYGEVNYLDEEAPAVGEMVWRMFATAGVEPSAAAATNAFVALSTDTGDFRYSNATARAFAAAAEMVERGADPARVAAWVHESRTAPSVRLLGEALRTLELDCDGRLATLHVDREAFARAGATPADTESIINAPRAIAGVRAVAFFKQWERGVVRVSLRSKGEVDVQAVAALLGGGGHTNASGCTIEGDLETAMEQLKPLLAAALDGGP
jgi:phosphoesterase RecJ-like protein